MFGLTDSFLTYKQGKGTPLIINQLIFEFKECFFDVLEPTYLNGLKIKTDQWWIAGGAISSWLQNQKIRDIDLYFSVDKHRDRFPRWIGDSDNSFQFTFGNHEMDVVKRTYKNPLDCISNFDFTVCMAAVTADSFYCHEHFFIDLATKNLSYRGSETARQSLLRTQKYFHKGYVMGRDSFDRLIEFASLEDELPAPEPNQDNLGTSHSGSMRRLNPPTIVPF